MIIRLFALALAALGFAAPAYAQDMWRHAESGVSVPRRIGEMRLHSESDASEGRGQDVAVQLGDALTPVTLYVYRAAYPNPALWFERTRLAMGINVGAPTDRVAPDGITVGNASAPNALREDIAISSGRYKATSVAIAQAGEWIVKARISSTTLDRAGVAARMDALLAALRFENMPAPHPLVVPGPCEGEVTMRGRPVANPSQEAVAMAGVQGMLAMSQSRGQSGLAANPAEWCRVASAMPAEMGAVYRPRTGGEWVALITDAGRSVAGMRLELPGSAGAATFVTTQGTTSLIALYDELPEPDAAIPPAIPVLAGQARGLVAVSTEPPRAERRSKR